MSKAGATGSATEAGTDDGCVDTACHGCGQTHQNATTKVLPDGRRVVMQSEEWRHHCEVQWAMRLPDKARKKTTKREYIEMVRQARGDDAANRLRRDMVAAWRQQHESE